MSSNDLYILKSIIKISKRIQLLCGISYTNKDVCETISQLIIEESKLIEMLHLNKTKYNKIMSYIASKINTTIEDLKEFGPKTSINLDTYPFYRLAAKLTEKINLDYPENLGTVDEIYQKLLIEIIYKDLLSKDMDPHSKREIYYIACSTLMYSSEVERKMLSQQLCASEFIENGINLAISLWGFKQIKTINSLGIFDIHINFDKSDSCYLQDRFNRHYSTALKGLEASLSPSTGIKNTKFWGYVAYIKALVSLMSTSDRNKIYIAYNDESLKDKKSHKFILECIKDIEYSIVPNIKNTVYKQTFTI